MCNPIVEGCGVDIMIEVKEGFLLSPSLFNLYIDEISNYKERLGGSKACLPGVVLPKLLCVDDIVFISNSQEDY